jgi:hypothetical protein
MVPLFLDTVFLLGEPSGLRGLIPTTAGIMRGAGWVWSPVSHPLRQQHVARGFFRDFPSRGVPPLRGLRALAVTSRGSRGFHRYSLSGQIAADLGRSLNHLRDRPEEPR